MNLTNEQKIIIDLLLDIHGKDWFEFDTECGSKYNIVLKNLNIFESKIGLDKYDDFALFFRIRNNFYKKYNRSKKLSSFLSPS